MQNYIPDLNRFKLAAPPAWWLRKLAEFDESLVIVPSRQAFLYRLAQKRHLDLPSHMTHDLLWKESDTRMLANYGLIPVTTIKADPNWSNPLMWKDLAERAPWRNGGAEKVSKIIDEHEYALELAKQKVTSDNLLQRAKAGWAHYQHRTGARTSLAHSAPTPNGQSGFSTAPARPAGVQEMKPRIILAS